jgi:hypothetical protein
MHIDNDGLAACPSCGALMRFSRTVSLINDVAEMRIFECKPCRLVITAEHLLQVPELADGKPLAVKSIDSRTRALRHRALAGDDAAGIGHH